MSIQTDLSALLSTGIVGTRVYPSAAPDSPVAPYITYFRVSAVEQNSMDGNGGDGNLMNTRFQIDVWAATYSEAQSKAQLVKDALKGWAVQNVTELEQDLYESDTKIHRVMLDVSTWHN
jgi:hydroxylamine reductase (hybrid-cluster protein)